jgi:hypothetical protein
MTALFGFVISRLTDATRWLLFDTVNFAPGF